MFFEKTNQLSLSQPIHQPHGATPMSDIVYLNGEFMPIEKAYIPVLDRGFIFGDGVYEVIPAYSKHPFRLAEHLRRLQHSLDKVRITNPHSDAEWSRLTGEILQRNAGDDQSVYLQVTRGVAKRDHAFPKGVKPTVFMMSTPLVTPAPALVESGVACITAQDHRWLNCDIKSVSLLGNCMLRQLSADAGRARPARSAAARSNRLTAGILRRRVRSA